MTSPSNMEHIKHLCGYRGFFLTARFVLLQQSSSSHTHERSTGTMVGVPRCDSQLDDALLKNSSKDIREHIILYLNLYLIYKLESNNVVICSVFVHKLTKHKP